MVRNRFAICILAAGVLTFGNMCRAEDGTQSRPSADKSRAVRAEKPRVEIPWQDGSPAETAGRIIQRMRAAEDRITKKDTGTDTRELQKKAVDDLQALIDAANRMKSQQQQSSQRSQANRSSVAQNQQRQEKGAGKQDSGQGGETRQADDAGINPTEARGESTGKEAETAGRRRLMGEVWGHLPETLRQKLRNDLGEKTLPGYDDLVRRYFEALAEEWKPGSKSSEKKIE